MVSIMAAKSVLPPLRLRNDRDAPRAARAALTALPAVHPDVRETAALLVSELVTNSVRHAGLAPTDEIELAISVDGVLHVAVTDGGPGISPAIVDGDLEAEGGRGLMIVSRLALRWGAERGRGRVWFELELAPVRRADGARAARDGRGAVPPSDGHARGASARGPGRGSGERGGTS
jgi:anti-sigma regulatory factor (Ser/Thr protein kinase)